MTAPPNHHRRCRTVVIERMDYRAALDLQHRIVAARLDGRLDQPLDHLKPSEANTVKHLR